MKVFKAHAELAHIPFVFLSDQGSPNDVLRFLAAGASQYVHKPATPRKVLRLVAKIIDA